MPKSIAPFFLISAVLIMSNVRAIRAQSAPEKLLVGDTNVETIESYKGDEPLPKPDKVVVYDFVVPSDVVTMDESMAARLHRRHMLLGGADSESTPEAVSERVQASFSRALVDALQNTSVPAEKAAGANAALPTHALAVQGRFTAVNEGNRSKRVMIGFGRGASDVQAHVTVSLTTDTQPIVLSEFNLTSQSGKKPGAAATMGVGSAAAGAATGSAGDKKASVEADASRMAKAVAKQIQEIMSSQNWTPHPQSRPN